MQALSVVFVAVLTAAAAQLSFPLPFTPVPFTIQPMIVLIGAAALGSRLGALSQILYLMLGVAGLPVFAFSPELPQGFARLLGPTGGYLMAYPLAAFVTGWLAERGLDRRYRHVDPGDGGGPVGDLRRRRAVARATASASTRGAGHRPLSVRDRGRDQDRRRGPGAAERVEASSATTGDQVRLTSVVLLPEDQEVLIRQERLLADQPEPCLRGVLHHHIGADAFVRRGPRAGAIRA